MGVRPLLPSAQWAASAGGQKSRPSSHARSKYDFSHHRHDRSMSKMMIRIAEYSPDSQHSSTSDEPSWTKVDDRAERRKVQNRLNKRAWRARQVLRKAQKSNATKENAFRFPATWAGVLAVLPGSPSHDLAAGGPPKDEVAIFAQTLMAGAVLDQAKVLCPLLENELLRQVWWTGANVFFPSLEKGEFRAQDRNSPSWSMSYVRHALADPLLFYALATSNAKAIYVQSDANNPMLHRLMIEVETKTLRMLREEFDSPTPNIRDELLFAVVQVSAAIRKIKVVPRPGRIAAFRPRLMALQNIHIASLNLAYDTPHWSALRKLVGKKGGLQNVAMHGLAEYMNLMDLFQASMEMNQPYFDLCCAYSECEQTMLPRLRQKEQERNEECLFPLAALEQKFQDVIWDMRCYLRILGSILESVSIDTGSEPVAGYRNTIHYRLLSLPKSPLDPVREACRLGIMIFAYGVTFPFQNTSPMLMYAEMLRQLLPQCGFGEIHKDLHLWLLLMGAMATYETDAMSWFVDAIKKSASDLGLKSWSVLRLKMQKFLWFEASCNEGALEIWLECLSKG